ncbi:GGDEF domain-containing protein [Catenovulum agarivorans DS-2]|uniref:diguanylate cyclase n=1 Tax=Catenovulum agarivorans DS-2 TaxID=1328313 RepID=W7Q8V6_9ALTE|nr:GGDEF domain-containing protein [Catenovulum agarivorans]EWH09249.1 GGDEF domain-containing protein [Catenovulum agarivorans DS-2]
MDNLKPPATITPDELSKLTLAWLNKYQLAPTPINYAVIYACSHPNNQKLRSELQQLIANNQTPDNYLLAELHQKYLEENLQADNETLSAIHKVIVNLQTVCEKSQSDVSQYQSTLHSQASKLNDTDNQHTVDIVNTIIVATEKAQLAQNQFKDSIYASQNDIKTLQQKLKTAQQQAQTDSLTGLANRRGMENFLNTLTSTSHICALLFDIDNFKQLNDTYGHGVGDIILQKVAQQIAQLLGPEHIAIRYGGEEFLVLMINQARDDVFMYAETVRENIEKLKLVHGKTRKRLPQVTISVGLSLNRQKLSVAEAIEQADSALYQAKSSGKNRVCLSS